MTKVVQEVAHFIKMLAASLDVVLQLDLDLSSFGASKFFSGSFEFIVETSFAFSECADEVVIVVAFSCELLQLFAKGDMVIVQVLEEFSLFLQLCLILGD